MRKGVPTLHAPDQAAWRNWLAEHHAQAQSVWLIIYRKAAAVPSVYYPEAVDEALCFGWIDSKPNKRDEESYFQFFSRRNPKSNWSRVNKEKVSRLIVAGRMAAPGYALIETAKANGCWNALDEVEALIIPPDLGEALDGFPLARQYFEGFPPSTRRGILEWIFSAKRAETRAKRIAETARLAQNNVRANQYRS